MTDQGVGTGVDIARTVARMYRNQLLAVDPDTCRVLDRQLAGLGVTWLIPRQIIHADDDLVSTAVAAEIAGVGVETVKKWRTRGVLGFDGVRVYLRVRGLDPNNHPRFRVGEVRKIAAILAQRRVPPR